VEAPSSGDGGALVEINVTPMIDVLLSLLIIFMVAAPPPPKQQQPLQLPVNAPVETPSSPNATLLVTIDKDGSMKLGEEPLTDDFDAMVKAFATNEKAQSDNKVAIKADEDVPYGKVIRVMSAAREADIQSVGVASERF
jgi:biopolymer transport protein ExbD